MFWYENFGQEEGDFLSLSFLKARVGGLLLLLDRSGFFLVSSKEFSDETLLRNRCGLIGCFSFDVSGIGAV